MKRLPEGMRAQLEEIDSGAELLKKRLANANDECAKLKWELERFDPAISTEQAGVLSFLNWAVRR